MIVIDLYHSYCKRYCSIKSCRLSELADNDRVRELDRIGPEIGRSAAQPSTTTSFANVLTNGRGTVDEVQLCRVLQRPRVRLDQIWIDPI